ncbi:MAG: YncE family protein [Bacteroidales bacterium]
MIRSIFLLVGICCAFFGKLRAQHPAFAGCDYSQGIAFVMEDNRIVWQHEAAETNDIWVLPGGNILFSTGKGVLEMTRQNDTVFHYQSESSIFACQRLADGNTFVAECSAGNLLEISPAGEVVKRISILPAGKQEGGFGFMRNARKLENGNYLVAHYSDQMVCEYDPQGKPVKRFDAPGGPHSVVRLPDGNTLVSVADMNQNPRLSEFNSQGELVWEFSNKDIESGDPLKFLGGMHVLENGDILFANWSGHDHSDNRIDLFRIDRNKNVLFSFNGNPFLKTMSSVYLLPGAKTTVPVKTYH